METNLEISLVLPDYSGHVDFDALNCTVYGPDINIVDDGELNVTSPVQVLEIVGAESKICFYPECSRPYLVLHFKSMKRFMSFQIICVDEKGRRKCFQTSNKISFVTIDEDVCKMPLQIQSGWEYACLDLEDIMVNAFGATYSKCLMVEVTGSCRLAKVFFQSRMYSDIELPNFLKVVN
jgi:hypothetical protein